MRLEDMHIQPYTHNAYSSCFSSKYVALVFPGRYRELHIRYALYVVATIMYW